MAVLRIAMPYQTERELRLALGLLTIANIQQMLWEKYPELYGSDIEQVDSHDLAQYAREGRGHEEWQTAALLRRSRKGDCEDLACFRVAQLILRGERKARAVPIRTRAGWHIVVRRADGTIEDPSKRLGMGRKQEA